MNKKIVFTLPYATSKKICEKASRRHSQETLHTTNVPESKTSTKHIRKMFIQVECCTDIQCLLYGHFH